MVLPRRKKRMAVHHGSSVDRNYHAIFGSHGELFIYLLNARPKVQLECSSRLISRRKNTHFGLRWSTRALRGDLNREDDRAS
jgi:hypothetical protein